MKQNETPKRQEEHEEPQTRVQELEKELSDERRRNEVLRTIMQELTTQLDDERKIREELKARLRELDMKIDKALTPLSTKSRRNGKYENALEHEQESRCVTARSEEHTSELQSLMRNSYAVFSLKKK